MLFFLAENHGLLAGKVCAHKMIKWSRWKKKKIPVHIHCLPRCTNSCCKIPDLSPWQPSGCWAQKTKPWLTVDIHCPQGAYSHLHTLNFRKLDSVTELSISQRGGHPNLSLAECREMDLKPHVWFLIHVDFATYLLTLTGHYRRKSLQ